MDGRVDRARSLRMGVTLCLLGWMAVGCARLPYTVKTVYQDTRVSVRLLQEVEPTRYDHPLQLSRDQVAAVLRGFSIREEVRIPLRWFAEEKPPKPLFREAEVDELAPHLVEGLKQATPSQRVAFEVYAPGFNPAVDRDVTAGWLAVRGPNLFLTIEYLHTLLPTHRISVYETTDRYSTPPELPGSYTVFFEPGRFWTEEPATGRRGVEFREFLKSAPAQRSGG